MRVYIGCFGSGLGHAGRMLEVARALAARGADLEFSSSGEVAALIESRGYRCNRLPLADVKYSESGAFMVKETLLDSPSILARTDRQFFQELLNIGRFDPDVVLSDSALSTVLAAKAYRIPTYAILNQLNLTSSHGEAGALTRLFSVGLSASMGKLWELSDGVIVPDLPPPFTISEKNLWGSGVEKMRYVGFIPATGDGVSDEAADAFSRDARPRLFWQVSGPPKTRSAFLELALNYGASLSREFAVVISGGDPLGSATPVKMDGFWYYEWCAIADVYFRTCDLVVSRAGHGTIGQAITSSKPSLLVPIPRQPEQEGNAEKAARLGVSIALRQADMTPEALRASLGALLERGYAERAAKLGRFARGYDARASIVETVESAASGARP